MIYVCTTKAHFQPTKLQSIRAICRRRFIAQINDFESDILKLNAPKMRKESQFAIDKLVFARNAMRM